MTKTQKNPRKKDKELFCFVYLQVKEGESLLSIHDRVAKAFKRKETYPTFAHVPIKPRTVVLRLDLPTMEAYEVARSHTFLHEGKSISGYHHSVSRSSRIEPFSIKDI